MKKKFIIKLKELEPKDVTKKYHKWMNDYNVVKYTAQSEYKHTYTDILNFVKKKKKSKNEFLYGIYLIDKNKSICDHIGNIKLGPINFKNLTADISYFIGERKHWGKGLATQAISEIIKIAKSKFKLKKLQAGHWKKNLGSKKVLKRNNFKLEGILRSQIVVRNKRYDRYLYGLLI